MREIKFRAWDKKEGGFITSTLVALESAFYEPDKYVLQQYTGLKDKNGEEIYEGDIVEWKHKGDAFEPEVRKIGTVHYEGIFLCCGIGQEFYEFDHSPDTLKVIGNIFENENLIKDKDEKELIKTLK